MESCKKPLSVHRDTDEAKTRSLLFYVLQFFIASMTSLRCPMSDRVCLYKRWIGWQRRFTWMRCPRNAASAKPRRSKLMSQWILNLLINNDVSCIRLCGEIQWTEKISCKSHERWRTEKKFQLSSTKFISDEICIYYIFVRSEADASQRLWIFLGATGYRGEFMLNCRRKSFDGKCFRGVHVTAARRVSIEPKTQNERLLHSQCLRDS